MNTPASPLYSFLGPRYWPVWLGLGLLRASLWLPFSARLAVGRGLGRLSMWLMPRRRRIAAKNLALCFPDMSAASREALLAEHFESLGIALIETAMCWWSSDREIRRLLRVEGLENLRAATEEGRGVIMLTGHFTPLDLGGRFVTMLAPVAAVYRPHKNRLFDEIVRRGRERSARETIPKQDVRAIIRALRRKRAVWFAPDQSHRRRHSAVVPFFGVPAPTNTATSNFARMSGAPVVPFIPVRLPESRGYKLLIMPALEGFPGQDPAEDAARINRLLENEIRKNPAQYLWVHRRFKPADPDSVDHYAELSP
ncbi:MAG: LpxL/LpxP family Kdo(2)-lipid IV(A) lauroyl/palmitoleoyl acyltransferase [Gammaproteobacteria bacterium]